MLRSVPPTKWQEGASSKGGGLGFRDLGFRIQGFLYLGGLGLRVKEGGESV